MDSAAMSLLGAFVLSIIGLFVFVWSMRQGLLGENPKAASIIFARGEIGKVDDPALGDAAQDSMQAAAAEPGMAAQATDANELRTRLDADTSTAFPAWPWSTCVWRSSRSPH